MFRLMSQIFPSLGRFVSASAVMVRPPLVASTLTQPIAKSPWVSGLPDTKPKLRNAIIHDGYCFGTRSGSHDATVITAEERPLPYHECCTLCRAPAWVTRYHIVEPNGSWIIFDEWPGCTKPYCPGDDSPMDRRQVVSYHIEGTSDGERRLLPDPPLQVLVDHLKTVYGIVIDSKYIPSHVHRCDWIRVLSHLEDLENVPSSQRWTRPIAPWEAVRDTPRYPDPDECEPLTEKTMAELLRLHGLYVDTLQTSWSRCLQLLSHMEDEHHITWRYTPTTSRTPKYC